MARKADHTFGSTVTRTAESQILTAHGVAVPLRLDIEVDDSTIPYLVEMVILIEHGRALCDSLTATRRPDGPPVTNQQLRRIPVEAIYLQALRNQVWPAQVQINDGVGTATLEWFGTAVNTDEVVEALRGRSRRTGTEREDLKRSVVEKYKELVLLNPEPRAAIARACFISPGYVGRLLSEARRDGLLGPAPSGRAGEIQPEPTNKKARGRR